MNDVKRESSRDTIDNTKMVTADEQPQAIAYCEVCGEAIEVTFTAAQLRKIPGRNFPGTRPRECACVRARKKEEAEMIAKRGHQKTVERLTALCFAGNYAMAQMTFDASSSSDSATLRCRKYASDWEEMRSENIGLLLWGTGGTGKSYMAACIANALIEDEVSVRMMNLSDVMNTTFESREELLRDVRQCSLLIIDDFGMGRESEFGMEIAFQVIDARYQSRKPLIVTTNLSVPELRSPRDREHKRIYDRILEMCIPIKFTGGDLRNEIRRKKLDHFSQMMKE